MGLKCSVLGHTYGEATVEREREEQGSEVVITILERESCERCGETRIVSENKEVTSIETPSDIAGDMLDDEGEAGDMLDDEGEAGDAEADDGSADESEFVTTESDEAESSPAEPVDPDADDAEILDPDADSEEEIDGDSELEDPSTDVEIPDADGEVKSETDPEEDDGLIIDADEETEEPDAEREPGQWPEEAGDDDDDWAPETDTSASDAEATADPEPAGGSAVTVPEGKFHCPECDFMTDVESSSLREGDFCPECHKGALVTDAE